MVRALPAGAVRMSPLLSKPYPLANLMSSSFSYKPLERDTMLLAAMVDMDGKLYHPLVSL